MADTVQTPDQIKAANEAAIAAEAAKQKSLDETSDALRNVTEHNDKYGSSLDTLLTSSIAAKEASDAYINSLGEQGKTIAGLLASFNGVNYAADGVDTFFKNFNIGLEGTDNGVGKLGKSFKGLKEIFNQGIVDPSVIGAATSSLGQLAGAMGLGGAAAKLLNGTQDGIKAVIKLVENHVSVMGIEKKLTQDMLDNASKIGAMGNIFGDFSAPNRDGAAAFDQVHTSIEKTRVVLNNLSRQTGVDSGELTRLYSTVQQMPMAFDKAGNAISNMSGEAEQMSLLSETTKVAAGSGMKLATATDQMRLAMEAYNIKASQSLEFIARQSIVSNTLGVSLDIVTGYMDAAAEKTKLFGIGAEHSSDAIKSSAEVFEKFESRLLQTGVSAKTAAGIVGGFTEQVLGLNVAQRALLSQQSGGPGGLMGAFQISKEIREGHLDDVVNKVEASLKKQMGGRLVTEEDATKSQAAAAQYQQQISLLSSGAYGALTGGSEQSAQRLLESWTKGTKFETDKGMMSGEKAVGVVAGRGDAIQQQNNTALQLLKTSMDQLTQATEQLANQNAKHYFDNDASKTYVAGAKNQSFTWDKDPSKMMQQAIGQALGDTSPLQAQFGAIWEDAKKKMLSFFDKESGGKASSFDVEFRKLIEAANKDRTDANSKEKDAEFNKARKELETKYNGLRPEIIQNVENMEGLSSKAAFDDYNAAQKALPSKTSGSTSGGSSTSSHSGTTGAGHNNTSGSSSDYKTLVEGICIECGHHFKTVSHSAAASPATPH